MKKLATAIFISLSLIGCSSPQSKVDRLERDKQALMQSSGFNACMQKIEVQKEVQDLCIRKKVASKGYTDGIDCGEEYGKNPICDGDRFTTEMVALSECIVTDDLNEFDCADLLTK